MADPTVIPLPLTSTADPNVTTLEEAVERVEESALGEEVELSASDKLMRLAGKSGDFSEAIELTDLVKIGLEVVEEYEQDKVDRKEWEETVLEALDWAAQKVDGSPKNHPWPGASNVHFPILTVAAMQFNARMYPAVIKGDEAVLCKVIGQDNGRPMVDANGQPMTDENGQPVWQTEPGAKSRRARRVSEYMNTTIFYRMEDWESDTDALLMQLPIVGCVFRKLWYDPASGEQKSAMVPALRIFVPKGARSVDTTPRLTEEIPDQYPHQINEKMRSGFYRAADLWPKPAEGGAAEQGQEDNAGARLLLEQHRLIDMDEDGVEEPYIVTVDHETQSVLRIEANFGPNDIKTKPDGDIVSIQRGKFYIKYGLFPNPKGEFYDIGLGHLLRQMGRVINTAINQLMDAGTAQVAGGGFIASGVRLQSRGGGSVVRMEPGVYRTVDVNGSLLREAIVERTLPNPSPITFQVLDLIMGAARDIAGAKDVITGEASNNGQVGTTLALIEQGLQVFNATAKRVFRSLKDEYTLLKENIYKHGGEAAAADYMTVLDDPEADFAADFNSQDMDIRPVSDPSSVTRMQKMAKAQFVMSTMGQLQAVGGDLREAMRRSYEAADIEDIDKLLPPPQPQPQMPPDPRVEAEAQATLAKAQRDAASAEHEQAKTGETVLDTERKKFDLQRDAAVTRLQFGVLAG